MAYPAPKAAFLASWADALQSGTYDQVHGVWNGGTDPDGRKRLCVMGVALDLVGYAWSNNVGDRGRALSRAMDMAGLDIKQVEWLMSMNDTERMSFDYLAGRLREAASGAAEIPRAPASRQWVVQSIVNENVFVLHSSKVVDVDWLNAA